MFRKFEQGQGKQKLVPFKKTVAKNFQDHPVPAQLVHQHRVAGDRRPVGPVLDRNLHRRRTTLVRRHPGPA